MSKIEIYYERPLSGGLLLSAIVGDQLIKHRYFDYTKAEATRLFRQKIREELAK